MKWSPHRATALYVVALLAATATWSRAQVPDPAYQTRDSQCKHEAPPGAALSIRRSDSGIATRGYTAERTLTLSADAKGLEGGEVVVCTEYGRVEIIDSDDDQVRVQIRVEGYGEGSPEPAQAAARVIDETPLHTHITKHDGRLLVRVWHSRLGFTNPGAQPAWLSVRVQVPARGSYRVRTEAFHGLVAVRRLTLVGAVLRGNVGEKFKGIPGFIGATELDNVELAGDVDIDNLVGLPGIRAPVSGQMATLAAPILVKASVHSNSQLRAVTGGDINIAIQPAPDVGVRATGESNIGSVRLALDGAAAGDSSGDASFRVRRSSMTPSFESQRAKVDIRASSATGNVSIASIPAAPLASPREDR